MVFFCVVEFCVGMLVFVFMLLGVVLFGLIYGVLVMFVGMFVWFVVVMSVIVFGGVL